MADIAHTTLEVCENAEWLTTFGPLSGTVDSEFETEASTFFASKLHGLLTNAGFETRSPKGQRILCHGWNGANTFTHKLGPVGTFDDLSDAQVNDILNLVEAAANDTCSKFPTEAAD